MPKTFTVTSDLNPPSGNHTSSLSPLYSDKSKSVVVESTLENRVYQNISSGLIGTVIKAYNQHHNLILRPDDIWLTILSQFNLYVNANSETLRDKFVDFQGKKELKIVLNGTLKSGDTAQLFQFIIQELGNLIDTNIKSSIRDLILPNFSTTTTTDTISAGITMISVFKNYFDYKCILSCGIPNVTLLGTVDDWILLLNKTKQLSNYNFQSVDILIPILEQFITVFNDPNIEFWSHICDYRSFGSGPSYISGWITAFCAYDEKGIWQYVNNNTEIDTKWAVIDTNDIPPGSSSVTMKIDDNGDIYDSEIVTGISGHYINDDLYKSLQPTVSWGLYRVIPSIFD